MTTMTSVSPQFYARLAGAIYLAVIVFGGYTEGVVMASLVVGGDTGSTMRNILAAPTLWNLTTLGDLIVPVIAVVQLWLEYVLVRPVNKRLAQLFVLFNLVSLAVEAVSKMFLLLVMPILTSTGLTQSFSKPQIEGLAGLAMQAHGVAFNITLIFFGWALLILGYLIVQSRYLPRWLGGLVALAGASYLAACVAQLFFPAVADVIVPGIFLPILLGEGSLCVWLLIKGVDLARWDARQAEI